MKKIVDLKNERRRETKAIEISYKCGRCATGFMQPSGEKPREKTPHFPHVCSFCKVKQFLDKRYPHVIFEPILVTLT